MLSRDDKDHIDCLEQSSDDPADLDWLIARLRELDVECREHEALTQGKTEIIVRLRAENAKLKEDRDSWRRRCLEREGELSLKERQYSSLLGLLKKRLLRYGDHLGDCEYKNGSPCTCGYFQAFKVEKDLTKQALSGREVDDGD